jgi:hypothetical protein
VCARLLDPPVLAFSLSYTDTKILCVQSNFTDLSTIINNNRSGPKGDVRGRKKDVFHLFDDATLKRYRTRFRGFRKRRTSSSTYTRSFSHRQRPNRCPKK